MKKVKVIKIDESTHKRLASLGTLLDSYDSVIVQLLNFYDKHQARGGGKK
jgi:hypothetical protein